MVFTVKLSQASTQTVKVDYNTADNSPAVGAATAVQDYVPKSGTLTFAPGVTIQTITIVINGDPLDEPDENFFINLSNPIGAGIQDPTAVGLILDDDLPAPLLVLGGAATSGNNAGAVSNDAVQPLLTAAIEHWRAAGADLLRLNNLDALQGQVTDLPHSTLGLASQDLILIDRDAAGYGWFVDSTPLDDREFEVGVGSPASGLVDLLSVVTHELGHLLGYGHEHDGQDVMGEYLPVGNRRLPAIDRKDEDWSAHVDLALIDIAKTRHPPVNVVSQELPLDTRRKTAILASQGVTPRLLMKASAGFDELGTKDKPATIASSLKPVTKAFSQVDDELLELLVSSQSTRPRRK